VWNGIRRSVRILDRMQQNLILVTTIVLVGLIAIAVIIANLGLAGESPIVSGFATWGQGVVLAAIVSMALGIWKGVFSESKDLLVNVKFPVQNARLLTWNVEKSTFSAFNRENKQIATGTVHPVSPKIGEETSVLVCTLPPIVFASHYILMELEEIGGVKWTVNTFYPNTIAEEAVRMT
jgi:hypothetical protein